MHPGALTHSRHDFGSDWVVDVWEQPVRPSLLSYDASLVARHGGTIRLVAIDGVVNTRAAHPERTAFTAVHTIRGWLAAEPDPEAAINGAHTALHDPTLRPRQRNPFAAAAVADLNPDTGQVTARRYADCEVWVRRDDLWQALFPGDMLTAAARAAYTAHVQSRTEAQAPFLWQETHLDDPAAWVNPPIGFPPTLRPEVATLTGCEEVIVSSDGARLTPERCADVTAWVTDGIQSQSHGDLAVVYARRA